MSGKKKKLNCILFTIDTIKLGLCSIISAFQTFIYNFSQSYTSINYYQNIMKAFCVVCSLGFHRLLFHTAFGDDSFTRVTLPSF